MNFKVIAHTHWDREWYFSHYKSRVYSYNIFDEIIEFLEKNDDFKYFLLDGQTSIIEEYLRFHPYMKERLENLVKARRIFTGPWYSQTDTLVISAESILRNLLYGTNYANKLGHCMKIGYLPDSFGMSEQMPQIYNGFDMQYSMFRRGIANIFSKDREFYWKSPDGSKVFCHNIYHYGNMAYPPESEKEIEKYMDDMVNLLSSSSKTGNIVLFNGEDQKPIRKNLIEIIEKMNDIGKNKNMNVELVSPENLMETLEDNNLSYDTIENELTMAQHSRTHKSIFSTRFDLKQKNNYLENYLSNILEPVLSISYMLGFGYEKESIDYIWKKMLENAAHDSIGMCNSDITNLFINNRYDEVREFSKNLVELKLREISRRIEKRGIFDFQIFNLLPYKRDGKLLVNIYVPSKNFEIINENGEKIEYQLNKIEDVSEKIFKLSVRETGVAGNINPDWLNLDKIYIAELVINIKNIIEFGYETFSIKEITDETPIQNNKKEKISSIENSHYKVFVEDNKINLRDKKTKKIYENFIYLEDDGDEGDSYDYSEPSEDCKLNDINLSDAYVVDEGLYSNLTIEGVMELPANLKERSNKVKTCKSDIKLVISLDESELIKISVDFYNTSIEHRLRLVINPEIESILSKADQQFGTIERPTILDFPNWKEDGFNEKPRTIEPMQSYCTIQNDRTTLQVLTDDVREYQVIGEKLDRIAMTIFRSTPYLGKENLNDRPGRASGNTSETFDTRYINQNIKSNYYVSLYNYKVDDYTLARVSKDLFTPLVYYQACEFKNNTENLILNEVKDKKLDRNLSFLKLEGNVIPSAVKKAENSDSLILRYFNPSRTVEVNDAKVSVNEKFLKNSYKEVRFDEETINKSLPNTYNRCQARSFRYDLNRR